MCMHACVSCSCEFEIACVWHSVTLAVNKSNNVRMWTRDDIDIQADVSDDVIAFRWRTSTFVSCYHDSRALFQHRSHDVMCSFLLFLPLIPFHHYFYLLLTMVDVYLLNRVPLNEYVGNRSDMNNWHHLAAIHEDNNNKRYDHMMRHTVYMRE